MVRLVAYDESDATGAALRGLAGKLAADLPGTTEPPDVFGLFPQTGGLAGSDRIVGEGYMGQGFLTMVYTRDYSLGSDTVTLFVTDDQSGVVFAQWNDIPGPKLLFRAGDLSYDEDYCFAVPNSYYGNILTGLKNGKLVGMINFSDDHTQFMADWLASFPAGP
jgi:hypothetical protein